MKNYSYALILAIVSAFPLVAVHAAPLPGSGTALEGVSPSISPQKSSETIPFPAKPVIVHSHGTPPHWRKIGPRFIVPPIQLQNNRDEPLRAQRKMP